MDIITTNPVVEEGISESGPVIDSVAVRENLSAQQTINGGLLIELSYTDADARSSERVADAVGEATSEGPTSRREASLEVCKAPEQQQEYALKQSAG